MANLIGKQLLPNSINEIGSGLKLTFDELELLFISSSDALNDADLLHIYCTSDWYVNKYNQQLLTNQLVVHAVNEALTEEQIKVETSYHQRSEWSDITPISQVLFYKFWGRISKNCYIR